MLDDYEGMKSRITEYFHRVSDEQLKTDLEKAGYAYYKNIKTQVIDSFLAEDEFLIELLENIELLAMEHYDPTAMHDDKPPDDMEAWRNGQIVQLVNRIKRHLLKQKDKSGKFGHGGRDQAGVRNAPASKIGDRNGTCQ